MRGALLVLFFAGSLAAAVDGAKVLQRIVMLEPAGGQLSVSETVVLRNESKTTYNDPANGTVRFYLPPEAGGKVRVTAPAPGGMAVALAASKTGKPGVYKVDFPIPPGESNLRIGYTVPRGSPATFSGRSLDSGVPIRLVVPAGLTLQGEGVESLGQDPEMKVAIYGVRGPQYKVEIGEATAEDSGPGVEQILPRTYDNLYLILGLATAVLALGFVLLYRRPPTTRGQATPSPKR